MIKQVIVIRKDLKLDKGKTAVSVAHASLEAYRKSTAVLRKKWEAYGMKKVVLKANNLYTLKRLYFNAKKDGLPCFLVRDAGKTRVRPGTITALGIGPAESSKIDRVTGRLKML